MSAQTTNSTRSLLLDGAAALPPAAPAAPAMGFASLDEAKSNLKRLVQQLNETGETGETGDEYTLPEEYTLPTIMEALNREYNRITTVPLEQLMVVYRDATRPKSIGGSFGRRDPRDDAQHEDVQHYPLLAAAIHHHKLFAELVKTEASTVFSVVGGSWNTDEPVQRIMRTSDALKRAGLTRCSEIMMSTFRQYSGIDGAAPAPADGPTAGAAMGVSKTPSRKRKVDGFDGFVADSSYGDLNVQMAKVVDLVLEQKKASDCDLTLGVCVNFYNADHIGHIGARSVSFEWNDEQSLRLRRQPTRTFSCAPGNQSCAPGNHTATHMEPPATDELMLEICRQFLGHSAMLSRFLSAYPDAVTVDRGDGQVCINIHWPHLMYEFNTRQFGLPKRSRTSYAASRGLLSTRINHWSWPHLLNEIHPDAGEHELTNCSSVYLTFDIGKTTNPNGGRQMSVHWTKEQLKAREFGELDSTIASRTADFENIGTHEDILMDFLRRTVLEKRPFTYTDNDTADGMEVSFTIEIPGIDDTADSDDEDVFESY